MSAQYSIAKDPGSTRSIGRSLAGGIFPGHALHTDHSRTHRRGGLSSPRRPPRSRTPASRSRAATRSTSATRRRCSTSGWTSSSPRSGHVVRSHRRRRQHARQGAVRPLGRRGQVPRQRRDQGPAAGRHQERRHQPRDAPPGQPGTATRATTSSRAAPLVTSSSSSPAATTWTAATASTRSPTRAPMPGSPCSLSATAPPSTTAARTTPTGC